MGAKPTVKKKIDKLKGIIPPKTFILKTTVERAAAAKSALWTDVCGKVKIPKLKSNRVLARGDVEIVPADAETLEALKELAKTREDITKPQARWPMVMIYDIDSTMTPDQIPGCIAANWTDVGDVHTRAETLMSFITAVSDKSIPKQRNRAVTSKPLWWSDDLTISKRVLNRARRERRP